MRMWLRAIFYLMMSGTLASAEVRLPAIFGDHMLLQRGIKLPVWGWAQPGEKVQITLAGQVQSTQADDKGRWRVTFEPIESKQPLEMTVAASNTLTVRDILIGDVWICSGQSNMEWPVRSALDPHKEIAEADFPQIRLFIVENKATQEPQDDVQGQWVICSPQTVGGFSAVGFFFGRELHRNLKVPVGLIDSTWGGTVAEAWTDPDSLRSDPIIEPILQRYESSLPRLAEARKDYEKAFDAWRETALQKDPGETKSSQGWAATDFDDSGWKPIKVPGSWEADAQLAIDGAVWFRKEVAIPEAWQGKALTLKVAHVDDHDATYFNGERVGGVGAENLAPFWVFRSYEIKPELVKAGKCVIAVRVFDTGGPGGLHGPADAMSLAPKDGTGNAIALAGQWKYAVELALEPRQNVPPPPQEPIAPNSPNAPCNLYNAMIHPLVPFGITGAIWYQGESNANRAFQYRTLLPAMITGWRKLWGQGEFPFLIVQLANFGAATTQPVQQSGWAELREAQLLTASKLPRTAMVVITDIGDANDIHPRNKQDVGRRLALAARKVAYGQELVSSGPTFREMRIDGDSAVLSFDSVGGGLVGKGKLKGFAIAGEDRKFVKAEAKISGNTVVVRSPEVPKPLAVRYGWADNPPATLFNSECLPASPFRTDDWPGVTDEHR